MQAVASQAVATNGSYSFFMYSHADEATTLQNLPADASWADGSETMVSSSFEAVAATQATVSVLGPPQAPENGWLWPSRPDKTLPDGMRPYPASIRTTGATQLHAIVKNQTWDTCNSTFGPLIGPSLGTLEDVCDALAQNVANQITNCFSSGECTRADTLFSAGNGVAVSEDDINSWDSYETGGIYGYQEPIVYLKASYTRAYVFEPSAGDGSVIVTVQDPNNNPLTGANVLVDGALQPGTTDMNGQLTTAMLPAGLHEVEAQLYVGPTLPVKEPPALTAARIINLPSCSSQPLDTTQPCGVTGPVGPPTTCPNGWALTGECALDCPQGGCFGFLVPETCACFFTATPASCCFLDAERQVTVPAGSNAATTIRLCTDNCPNQAPSSACQSGLTGCPQPCLSNGDCDSGFFCSSGGTCALATSATVTILGQLYTTPGTSCTSPPPPQDTTVFPAMSVTCDPAVNPDGSLSTTRQPATNVMELGCADGHGGVGVVACWGNGVVGDPTINVGVQLLISDLYCGGSDNSTGSTVQGFSLLPGEGEGLAETACDSLNLACHAAGCSYNKITATVSVQAYDVRQ